MKPLRLRTQLPPWGRGRIEFLLGHSGAICEPVTLKEIDEGSMIVDPTFTLEMKEAQELMDELWQCGLRPSEGSGSAGQLKAVQYHLEDMRRLVFKNTD